MAKYRVDLDRISNGKSYYSIYVYTEARDGWVITDNQGLTLEQALKLLQELNGHQ
jgi:hypothetical protein